SIWESFIAIKRDIPVEREAPWQEICVSFRKSILTFDYPIIILVGIYSGMFSASEPTACYVLYALILQLIIFGSINLKDIYNIAASTGAVTSIVFILLAAGGAFSWIISYLRIPQQLTEAVLSSDPSSIEVLFIMSLFFLIS